ncbi:MAG: MarR family transcriptional regulator [Burkholderiales bacterium]|nr:MarR family transcriptional regulator [Burkholderiales bacterium]
MATSRRPAPRTGTQQTERKQSDSATRVLRRFRIVVNAIRSHFRSVEQRAGITGAQFWALAVVRDHPGIGVGELARSMHVHQSTASNLLRQLVGLGLVGSARDENDRRVSILRVTREGAKVLRKAPGPFAGVLPEALATLDEATLDRLDRDLGKLIDRLGTGQRGGGIPLASIVRDDE